MAHCLPAADSAFGPVVAIDCRGGFDFTLYFEQTALGLLPAALFGAWFPVRLIYLTRASTKTLPSRQTWLKLFIATCLLSLQIATLASWSSHTPLRNAASLPFAVFNVVIGALAIALSWLEDSKSVRPSSPLAIYLFLTSLLDTAQCRTLWLLKRQDGLAPLFTAATALKFVLAMAESRNKRRYLKPTYTSLPPESTTGIANHSFLWWVNGLFKLGMGAVIRPQDLFGLTSYMTSEYLSDRMGSAWSSRQKPERRFELPLATFKVLWFPFLQIVLPRLCLIALTFSQPLLIARVLDLLQRRKTGFSDKQGYGLIGAAFLIYGGLAVIKLHYHIKNARFMTMVRGAIITLVYDHLLQLPVGSCEDGTATTLISADVERITSSLNQLNELWARAIEVAAGIGLLTWQIGWVSVIPLVIVFLSFLGITRIASEMKPRQKIWLEAVQRRIATTTTMLSDMKSIKMMGLAPFFCVEVQKQRAEEVGKMASFQWRLVWQNVVQNIPWIMAPAFTFIVYTVQAVAEGKSSLSTTQAFTSLSIMTLMTDPAAKLLSAIPAISNSIGCFDRVHAFLVTEPRVDARQGPGSAAIQLSNVTIRGGDSQSEVLKNVDLAIQPSAVTLLMGPVGSGKSIMLKAVLGEYPCDSQGFIAISSKRVGFCAQTTWLPKMSIRCAIVGPSTESASYDDEWYRSCVYACDLEQDIAALSQGDETGIGEAGTTLSGGQKLRIALARAIYIRPDIVLLDDVLSGLDARTAKTVLDRLLGPGGLLRRLRTTVVLATHSTNAARYGDVILEIRSKTVIEIRLSDLRTESIQSKIQITTQPTLVEFRETAGEADKITEANEHDDLARATGDSAVYKYYFGGIGKILMGGFIIFGVIEAFCQSFSLIWLKWWTDAGGDDIGLYTAIYFILCLLTLLGMSFYSWILLVRISPKTSRNFHKTLLTSVIAAPMAFFSKADAGSLLNRFSQDMTLIESQLPTGIVVTITNLLGALAAAGLVASGSIYMSATLPLLVIAVFVLQHVYLRTSRQLRLLDIEAKGPVLTHFVESLHGLTTIRALGWVKQFVEQNNGLLDDSQKPFYMLECVQTWLSLVLDLIVGAEAVLVIGLAVGLRQSTSPGLLGVSLNNILLFSGSLSGLISGWTILETSLGSIARLMSFEKTVPNEDVGMDPETVAWPSDGAIEYKSVTAIHGNGSVGISNINLRVGAGQRLALCGRTGSGKSSFVATLLRLMDVSHGTISIDGVDVSSIRPNVVRKRLLTLPQDALVLPGSIRLNLDPEREATNSILMQSLEDVHLATHIGSIGLDGEIPSDFLSHGQKQLLALARALVKKRTRGGRILVLDEAMSSVDAESDAIMQSVVREAFSDCTVIAVVHRIKTILDFGMAAVLDRGEVVELGRPADLVNAGGHFANILQLAS
ncbi:unnamed protein product [Clonostachys rosea]|uniref:ABC transporter n=1 Tax=Bionectria ochroleuca TaxID=29856 RepID=A0ABY6U1D6_BIOOC|nr:unnamed protein product [Clonostachys rosea]